MSMPAPSLPMRDLLHSSSSTATILEMFSSYAAPWHQADHPSAADFESERQKRHSVTDSTPKPALVSIEAAPDNGAQGQGAGGGFDAGAYAFFGDPSGSGLELELGGLDDDGGGLLTADDDSTVKGLEVEDEVDPEELRNEEEDKEAREAFAKVSWAPAIKTLAK